MRKWCVGVLLKVSAIRKDAGLCCGSRLRSGEVFAYVGRNPNLKDLKANHYMRYLAQKEPRPTSTVQGYLANKKPCPPQTTLGS